MPENPKRLGGAWREDRQGRFSATVSEVMPFFFTDANTLRKKAFLGPAVAAMVVFVLLGHYLALLGRILTQENEASSLDPATSFIHVLAGACALAATYLIYQMCGHRKPWWWLSAAAGLTVPTILLALQHHKVLEFFEPNALSTGLFEELWKSAPVFLALGIGRTLMSPWREKLGVWEPLDGILLGVASAAAFGFVENLAMYGPGPDYDIAQALKSFSGHPELLVSKDTYVVAAVLGNLLKQIIRSIDLLFGHLAWSGLFGYFIGMAAMRPRSAPKLLAAGYLTAAALHALWDASAGFPQLIVVGLASYSALALAILKARKVSPDRKNNFASTFTEISPKIEAPAVVPANPGSALVIAGKPYPVRVGLRLFENDVPGLNSAGADGVVGEFNVNPKDPQRMGLKNLSTSAWIRTSATGDERTIEPGKSIHLAAGAAIHFGTGGVDATEGKVQ